MPNLPPAARCAALYRVSTARQAVTRDADDESLPLQRNAIRAFVTEHPGWTLVAEFAEEGISAFRTATADRDILQDVLRQARLGQFDMLLVFKADRLSRQAFEYPFILSALQKTGVQVVSVADEPGGKDLKTDGQYDKLLRFLEGWQAETESVNTSIRVTERMRQLAQQGPWWSGGRPPYGYRFDKTASPVPLVVDDAEAATVRQIFAWYLDEGLGGPSIIRRLSAQDSRTRHGAQWHILTMYRIMCNPVLTGRLRYGNTSRQRNHSMVKRLHDLSGVILSPVVPSLIIIPQDRWEQAMARLASYNRRDAAPPVVSARADRGPLLLTGLARCGGCGNGFQTHQHHERRRRKAGMVIYRHLYYQCQTAAAKGSHACPGQHQYSRRKVEPAVLAAVRRTLTALDTTAVIAEARRYAEQTVWQQTARADRWRRQLQEARQLQDAWAQRLNALLLHPDQSPYTEDFAAAQLRDAQARMAAAEAELAQIDAARQNLEAQRARLDAFLAAAPRWWDRFLAAEPRQQRQLLRHILERVELRREGFTLYYRVTPDALGEAGGPSVRWSTIDRWAGGAIS